MALESEGDGDPGAKRQRLDEHKEVAAEPEAGPVVRISALPDDVRRRILTHLPLKDAIRSSALAQGWRHLWKSRWAEPTSSRDIHLLPGDDPNKLLASLESAPRRRLNRLTFVFDNYYETMTPSLLRCFVAYAAECRVEDLDVEVLRCRRHRRKLAFRFPLSSPFLARLSLCNVIIDRKSISYRGLRPQPFHCLEVVCLHRVTITAAAFSRFTALCPCLHTLDMRCCDRAVVPPAAKLRTVIVAECDGELRVHDAAVPNLRSFRFSGKFMGQLAPFPFTLPKDAALVDLYICIVGEIPLFYSDLIRALPIDLSCLTVLTICSNVLEIASSLLNEEYTTKWPNLSNLQSLKELQLLLSGTDTKTLANICVLLRGSHCHNLERLFVQLPDISYRHQEDLLQGVLVESPEDGLGNLKMVKVTNFNWHKFEVQLVNSLLRKASSLHKLLLVSPNVTLQHVPGVQEADLSLLKEALVNGRMILSESDDPATQPFHSEVFIKV